MSFARWKRAWQIHRVARKYGLMEFLPGREPTRDSPRGERLRLALEELGPVFVKLGQALSTRPDILPADIAVELTKLQDQVPPFPGELAKAEIERALGRPVGQLFANFDTTPLASASIAQVHAATLRGATAGEKGLEVIVKVLRPGVEAMIRRDVNVMHLLAELVEQWIPESRRLKPREVVAEYENVIFDELDLMREGANASQLRRNWLGSELIYHPLVFWDYTRPSVLVMERVHGINIDELPRLRELGVDFHVLAERGVEIFFKQVFRDNFFHGDMHPGNILVDVTDPKKPRYNAVDFGIVGSLTASDQRYLAENFLAFFNRDYKRVAELHVQSGWVPAGTRVEDFESAIRTVCEPIFGRPIKDISFGFFLMRLFQIARRFQMPVQPQLVLLQKTLFQVEGLGRQLYPELDLWKTARPILRDWMRERASPRTVVSSMREHWPDIAEAIKVLPVIARRAIRRAYDETLVVRTESESLEKLRKELRRERRHSDAVIASGVVFLGGVVWVSLATRPAWIGWVLVLGGVLWLARSLTRR